MDVWVSDGLVSQDTLIQLAKEHAGYQEFSPETHLFLDWSEHAAKACVGCWSCWWKTPGRCIHTDMDDFYRAYMHAENVTFFLAASKGYVSSRFKTAMDRMIPLFLPYTAYHTGESMHVKRYERYPDIRIRYGGNLRNEKEEQLFVEYLHRCFYQFHSSHIDIKRYIA